MGVIVDSADFVNEYKVPKNDFVSIDYIIAQYEESILRQLLGVDLYAAFKADLSGQVPQTAPYTTIFAAIYQDDGSCQRISEGIKKMLMGFLKFYFIRDLQVKYGMEGAQKTKGETSSANSLDDTNIWQFHNNSVDWARTIQWYICKNSADFVVNYNGQDFEYAHWVL